MKSIANKFSNEGLSDREVLLQKIKKGLYQSHNGITVTTIQAKKRLKKWLLKK